MHFHLSNLLKLEGWLTCGINVMIKFLGNFKEVLRGLLVKLGHSNSGGKFTEVRMQNVQIGGSLSNQIVQLSGLNA